MNSPSEIGPARKDPLLSSPLSVRADKFLQDYPVVLRKIVRNARKRPVESRHWREFKGKLSESCKRGLKIEGENEAIGPFLGEGEEAR